MRRTILVISTDERVQSAIRSLEGPEVRLIEAATGLAAMFLCASEPVHVLVVDLATPGMDWQRLTGKLTQAFPALSVVLVPGFESESALVMQVREAFHCSAIRKQPSSVRAAFMPVLAERA